MKPFLILFTPAPFYYRPEQYGEDEGATLAKRVQLHTAARDFLTADRAPL